VSAATEEARNIMRELSSLTGEHVSSPRQVSLNDLAHHVKGESARPVRFELSKTEPRVKLDLWLGQQALAAAIRFMSTSVSVTSLRVATRILGKAALLTIEDDGATPNESELASAFAPFAKLHGRPRSCLGLTKLALMAAHGGGHVNAVAREPHGLRLVLTLPLVEAVASVDGPGMPLSKQRV
jgi:K+-sensing histidine kinase KdpD